MSELVSRRATLPGVVSELHVEDGDVHAVKRQDVAPVVDDVTSIRNHVDQRGRDWVLAGRIPVSVLNDWIEEWTALGLIGPGNEEALNGLIVSRIMDSDWSAFRATDMRL